MAMAGMHQLVVGGRGFHFSLRVCIPVPRHSCRCQVLRPSGFVWARLNPTGPPRITGSVESALGEEQCGDAQPAGAAEPTGEANSSSSTDARLSSSAAAPISSEGSLSSVSEEARAHSKAQGFKPSLNLRRLFEGMVDCVTPREKGDVKDVILMSLSLAVYVYISQKLVCAYCHWQSMGKEL